MTTGYVGPNGQWVVAADVPSMGGFVHVTQSPILLHKTNAIVTRNSANAGADNVRAALAAFTLPGGIMGLNGTLYIEAETFFTNSANGKRFRLQIGSTEIMTEYSVTTSTNDNRWHAWHNNNSLSAQKSRGSYVKQSANTTGFTLTTAIDTSVDQAVEFVGSWSTASVSGESLGLESFRAWVEYGA